KEQQYLLYDYFHDSHHLLQADDFWHVLLPRLGYNLFYLVPITRQFAAIGLIHKFNAPATIINEKWMGDKIVVTLYEGGQFKAYSTNKPKAVWVNNKSADFSYTDQLIEINIDANLTKPVVQISW